jgi:hypothetical protein
MVLGQWNVSRMYLDYLLGYMYAACILHVSRMSPSYQIRRSLDAFEIHVSQNESQVYPACILITSADTCIPNVSQMYPKCILHLSYLPLITCVLLECYRFEIHQDTFGIRVSFRIHAGTCRIHQDTYRIHVGNYPQNV